MYKVARENNVKITLDAVDEYKGELLYTDATEFLSYDGICWRENRQKAVGAVEEFLDMQLVDSRGQLNECCKALEKLITPALMDIYKDYLKAKAHYSFVMKYRNYKNIVNTQNAAKPMVATNINMFDAQENFLNTPAATYDLEKGLGGEMPHRSSDLLTKITNCSPGEDGRQLWEDARRLFFCGDQELIDYVQETVGLAAIGRVYVEALIIAYGEGRNGNAYFKPDRMNGPIVYTYKLLPGAENQIYDKIYDITISMKATDHLKMPELVSSEYRVYMDESEKQKYEELKKELVLQLPEAEITAANAVTLSGKLAQLSNGAIYGDDGSVNAFHERKIDALEDLIEASNGRPILVAYWFKHDLKRITERLSKLKVVRVGAACAVAKLNMGVAH